MGPARPQRGGLFSLLTFETMITGPVIHLIYWAGLGVVFIAAFGVAGAAVGVAIREHSLETALIAFPTLVGGLLIVFAGGLLWRAFCEFYVVIFRIGDDLSALRRLAEAEQAPAAPTQTFASAPSQGYAGAQAPISRPLTPRF
jgi:hypothetical protein